MNFDEFIIAVSKIKNIPLPAETSQFKMSPPFRKASKGEGVNSSRSKTASASRMFVYVSASSSSGKAF